VMVASSISGITPRNQAGLVFGDLTAS